jgi:protocatechuate 3,4-dioxygenase beta subunit
MIALLRAVAVVALGAGDEAEMRVVVVDADQKPIAGATVFTSFWATGSSGNQRYTTDEKGVALIRRPQPLQIFRVWVYGPGYASLFRGWETRAHKEGKQIPKTFVFQMQKATTVGGRAVDEKGKGIAGVRVEAMCDPEGDKKLPSGIQFNEHLAYGSGAAVTDKDGRWRLTNVPGPVSKVWLRFAHDDYVSDESYGGLQLTQGVTMARLRASEAVVRLSAGARLSGVVTGPDGKPVPNAVVICHDRPYFTPRTQVRSDLHGKYLLPTLKTGSHPITVVARGLMPQRRTVKLGVGQQGEDFRLEEGKTLRVRVVDEAGKPVQATFLLTSWRGKESLYNSKSSAVLDTGIPNATNAAGLFEWLGAPADAVTFRVSAEGRESKDLALTAGDGTQTVTLRAVPKQ